MAIVVFAFKMYIRLNNVHDHHLNYFQFCIISFASSIGCIIPFSGLKDDLNI